MRYRLLQCKTRIEMTSDDKLKWVFTQKHYMPTISGYEYSDEIHHVPFFLSLHAHLRIEEFLCHVSEKFLGSFLCRPLMFPYHFIYGLVSCHSVRDILEFSHNPYNIKDMEYFNLDEKGVKILDEGLPTKNNPNGIIIDVLFKDGKARCENCHSHKCKHAKYSLSLPTVQRILKKERALLA
jgi:hypothetical protein